MWSICHRGKISFKITIRYHDKPWINITFYVNKIIWYVGDQVRYTAKLASVISLQQLPSEQAVTGWYGLAIFQCMFDFHSRFQTTMIDSLGSHGNSSPMLRHDLIYHTQNILKHDFKWFKSSLCDWLHASLIGRSFSGWSGGWRVDPVLHTIGRGHCTVSLHVYGHKFRAAFNPKPCCL